MKAIKINLGDYVLSGGGANGESYDHKTDTSVMLKLYFLGKIQQPLDEMKLARKVYDMGIPTPEPGEYVVTEDGRYGIRFKRVVGKKSYSRATADEPEKVAQFAAEFAQMCLKLHATHVDTTQFENVKDRYYRLLKENPFFTTSEKDKLARFIANTPDEDTAIHGDLQYSNAIFVGNRRYFIDLAITSSMWEWSISVAALVTRLSSKRLSTCQRHWPSDSGNALPIPISGKRSR